MDSNPVGVRAQLETPLPQSLPQSSGVTGSRPTLALVDVSGADLDVLGPGRRAHRRALLRKSRLAHGRLSSGVTGWRPTLALVDAAPNSQESDAMPSMRPTSWGSARNRRARTAREAVEMVGVVSLGTLPAGTTEAQVDDMMMVLEVAGEATPTRSRPERHPKSNPSYIISACCRGLLHRVTNHRRLL